MTQSANLELPLYFKARTYQGDFFNAMRAGCKRAALVWHRRAGKDATVLNWFIEAMVSRVGVYYYFLPTYRQAKRIVWDGIQADGYPFLRHFPEQLVAARHETELKITFHNGSIFQLIGADNIDSIVGTNPVGVGFSEWSLMDPSAWDFMRPILAENGGWAVFFYTPRGRNWGWKLWQGALSSPEWFTSMKRADETRRDGPGENGGPVITPEAIQAERDAGMAEELIQQEFYCSFEGSMLGSYYGDLIERMRKDGRITVVPWDRDALVDTAWDLGVDDETVVGFTQDIFDRATGRKELALIDIIAGSGHGLEYYWQEMNRKPYTYGQHYGPHDLKVTEWGTGNTRYQIAAKLGLHFDVQPKLPLVDGIQAVRRMLPYMWADEERCARWVDAMVAYQRVYDEQTMTFKPEPLRNWATHTADMTRYRATAYQAQSGILATRARPMPTVNTNYSVFEEREQPQVLNGGGLREDYRRNRTDWRVFGR